MKTATLLQDKIVPKNDSNNITFTPKGEKACNELDGLDNKDRSIIPEVKNSSNGYAFKIDAVRSFASMNINTKIIAQDQLLPDKNGVKRFLPAPLLHEIITESNAKVALVRAGLGLGKSTASSEMMKQHYDGKGVAVSHRRKLTSQLCSSFDAQNYEQVKRLDGGEEIKRLGTTIQSLSGMVGNPLCSSAFSDGLLVIDESNSVAAEFTGKTIKNEAATAQSLRQAIQQSKTTICLDAHLDESTVNMLIAAGVKRSEMLLIDVKKPELEGYSLKLFRAEEDDAKSASELESSTINQIISDLNSGLKVIAVSLSATFLDSLDTEVSKQGLFNTIKITGDTSPKVFNSLDAYTYGNYQLVMLSPAMSTGISFDRDNADTCYVFLSNNEGTGSYQDGLQAMLRDRAIKSKTINCVYRESPIPISSEQQVAMMLERNNNALISFISENNLLDQFNRTRPDQNKTSDFLAKEVLKQTREKHNFLDLFLYQCSLKGAKIEQCNPSDFDSGAVTAETLKEEKQRAEEARVNAIIDAGVISDDLELDDDIDVRPMKDRAYIESFAAVNFDELDTEERKDLVEMILPSDGAGVVPKIRAFERSQEKVSTIKKLAEIAIIGASSDESDSINFAEKISTKKVHWPEQAKYTKLVLKACGVTDEGGFLKAGESVLNEKTVKGNGCAKALYKALQTKPEGAINSGMLGNNIDDNNIPDIKANPLPYMIEMINRSGIKLRKSRGKESYTVDAGELSKDLDLINRRKTSGINEASEWLDRVDEYLKSHQSRKAKAQELQAGVTESVPKTIAEAIAKAMPEGSQHLTGDAIQYLEPYHSRIEKGVLNMNNLKIIVGRFVNSLD